MKTLLAVLFTEFRTQVRRPVFWVTFAVVSALTLWEVMPNEANLARLSDLPEPAYAAARLMLFSTPIFALLAAVLTTGQVRWNRTNSYDLLLWTTPEMNGVTYVLGHYLGDVLAFGLLPGILCLLGIIERLLFLPSGFALLPYLSAYLLLGLLPVAFIISVGLLAGALVNSRFASVGTILYILWSTIFAEPGSDGTSPVFRLVGDLYYLVYSVPDSPFKAVQQASGLQTLIFEIDVLVSSLVVLTLGLYLAQKKRFHFRFPKGSKG